MHSTHSETVGGARSIARRPAMISAVAHVLLLACVTGCVSFTAAPTPTDGGRPDAADATTRPSDAVGIDAGEGECGAQFISGQFAPAGRTSGRFCLPLPNGVTVTHSNCRPLSVSVGAEGPLYVNTGGAPDMFAVAGPTMLGFTMDGRGLPCAAGAEACQFRTIGTQCTATVLQSGGLNQVVEVALQGPCVLRQYDVANNVVAEMSLVSLRMRGTLRLFREVATLWDGAVVDACE